MSLASQSVLLKTPINPGSGYGRDGIELASRIPNLGAELHLEPKYVGVPLPLEVAKLFARPRPSHFDVALNHEYPGELGFPVDMDKHASIRVGWTMFEFLSFGEEETEMKYQLADRLQTLDLVLAYDKVSYAALAEYMPDDLDRLQVLQGGYDADNWIPKNITRSWDNTFKFCMNGTMNARKNPWSAILAFKLLKDEHGDDFDAELHMKTTSQVFHPTLENAIPGLKIHYVSWSDSQLLEFYSSMNCLLAPSWGEGKNLPALEAQTTGCPVIVSNFGGHLEWASEEWAYLVDGPIEEHNPGMGSIRIYPEELAKKMWHVYTNRYEAKRKGELAASMIPAQCDWDRVLEKLELRINGAKPR